ncbi:MAG: cytochrome c [Vicinamibacterales bacterium]
MRNWGSRLVLLTLALALTSAVPRIVVGQGTAPPIIKKTPAPYVIPTDGKEMYVKYCGSCHGAQGKGDGPAAPAMKVPPTNLTLLMKNNNGKFPEAHFREVVMRGTMAAHGSADMPVWGEVFRSMDYDPAKTVLRIEKLTKYVETLSYPIK